MPADVLAALIAQKRQQYARTGAPDPFVSGETMRLIDALQDTRHPECRFVVTELRAGDHVLARHMGLQHHDVLSYWFPVYDREARNVSPGRLLLWHIIQSAAEHNIATIDYGEGDAPYKRELSTGSLVYGRADWFRGNLPAMVARCWQSMEWRFARKRHAGAGSAEQA